VSSPIKRATEGQKPRRRRKKKEERNKKKMKAIKIIIM
jgi:hypothetical protein